MDKPKIKEIRSKEYQGGRVDLFLIEIIEGIHKSVISLLLDIGFSKGDVQDFDRTYENEELFIFGMRKETKVYLLNISNTNEILLLVDSKISRDELLGLMERYFQIL